MPFITKEDGTIIWRSPGNEDIVKNRKDVYEVEESSIQKELTKDLQDKIAQHAKYLVSSNSGIIPFTNKNIYQTIKNLINSTPALVDIIVPVYNSIHITQQCLEKVIERTVWPYHIYIVDDASDAYTNKKLNEFANKYSDRVTLVVNKKNKGFSASVNKGIKAGSGEYICLLNSDVLVTNMWLTKLVLALKADERNIMASPGTNNTAIVDIPMGQGASYLAMNQIFEKFAVRNYPTIMATGFVLAFKRELTKKINILDESYISYGEDTQAWWDAINYSHNGVFQNYRAVMADDSYVFHARGGSFSSLGTDAHANLRKIASSLFNSRNPEFSSWMKTYSVKKSLGHLREKIPANIINDRKVKYKVCWVVHATDRCGGFTYIVDIVNELIEQGIDAKIALIKRKPDVNTDYIGELRCAPVIFEDYADFLNNFNLKVFRKGVVIAATAELSPIVRTLSDTFKDLSPLLHCQSYEPEIANDANLASRIKQNFHLIPNVISNSGWITQTLEKEFNIKALATINPGVDVDLFYPRDRSQGDERLTIMIPVSKFHYRGFYRVMSLIPIIEKEAKSRNLDIRILLVGVNKVPVAPSAAIALGSLAPIRLATVLGTEVDLFVEPSINHSYGLPALEAMSSGIPVISWNNKGISEYGTPTNSVIFDDNLSIDQAAKAIIDLLEDEGRRKNLSQEGLKVRELHSRKKLVNKFIEVLERSFNLNYEKRRIVMIVPHLRKYGGPTTMLSIANELSNHGHEVSITTLYSDINHEVTRTTDLPIDVNSQNIPKCDVAIINSDNPLCMAVAKSPQIKKKVLLKLSQNERFKQLEEQGLQQNWDAIITSSQWLKDTCENVPNGWNYPSKKAHRVGWWHYGHDHFAKDPADRKYNDGIDTAICIATLIHHHPTKGTQDAVQILGEMHKKYGNKVQFIGIGEIAPRAFQTSLPNFTYKYALNREELAQLLQSIDIWFGASHTEGLGRMALEAMSAGCAAVISDTKPEFADPEVNCLLYPIADLHAGVRQLERVVSDANLRMNLSIQGYRTAGRFADPNNCMENIENVLREIF